MIKKLLILYTCFPLICFAPTDITKIENVNSFIVLTFQRKYGKIFGKQREAIRKFAHMVVEEKLSLLDCVAESDGNKVFFEVNQDTLERKQVPPHVSAIGVGELYFVFKNIDGNTLEGQEKLMEKHDELRCKMSWLVK